MNPDSPTPREELEMRITALLLGQLSREEEGALREEMQRDAELQRLHDQLQQAIGLVRETVASPGNEGLAPLEEPQLSKGRREKLLKAFKTARPEEIARQAQSRVQRRELTLVAAMLVGLLVAAGLLVNLQQKEGAAASSETLGRMILVKREEYDNEAKAKVRRLATIRDKDGETVEFAENGAGRPDNDVGRTVRIEGRKGDVLEAGRVATTLQIAPPVANPTAGSEFQTGETRGRDRFQIVLPQLVEAPAEGKVMLWDTAAGAKVSDDVGGPQQIAGIAGKPLSADQPPANNEFFSVTGGGGGFGGARGPVVIGERFYNPAEKNSYADISDFSGLGRLSKENVGEWHFKAPGQAGQVGQGLGTEGAILGYSMDGRGSVPAARANEPTSAASSQPQGPSFGVGAEVPLSSRMGGLPVTPKSPPVDGLSQNAWFGSGGRAKSGAGLPAEINRPVPAPIVSPSTGLPARAEDEILEKKAIELDQVQTTPLPESARQPAIDSKREKALAQPESDVELAVEEAQRRTLAPAPQRNSVAKADPKSKDVKELSDLLAAAPSRPSLRTNGGVESLSEQTSSLFLEKQRGFNGQAVGVPAGTPETLANDFNQSAYIVPVTPAPRQDGGIQLNYSTTNWRRELDRLQDREGKVATIDRAERVSEKDRSLWATIRGAFGNKNDATVNVAVQAKTSQPSLLSPDPASFDSYWLQSEFEAVKSKVVLNEVVNELKLNESWGERKAGGRPIAPEDATRRLREMIDVRQDTKSGQMDIRVKAGTAEESAKIANAVAEAYKKTRQQAVEAATVAKLERKAQPPDVEQNLGEKLDGSDVQKRSLEPDVPAPRRSPNAPVPQPEIVTAENAYSTFSLNVSDVSFKLAASSLEQGQMPDAASVRTEEFINAFDYRDAEPSRGQRIAFKWERARYPFAHNRDLVRFSIKTAASGRQAGRPLNLVLLVDNSGSMERADRVRIRRECLRVLASQLRPEDRISVIAFARTPRLWIDGMAGNQAGELPQRVGELTPEGGTNLEEAMNLAYQTARRHFQPNGINRVVLLTDGAANLGDVEPESLKKRVESNRAEGVALDCFGIGWDGFNDDLLEVLSRNGDGRYGFINTPEAAASEFAGQLAGALRVAASDVKVQVQFNPQRVTAYRQMGYAKHQLKKEQFRDNTVDAAEIGAAEAGNALYVIEVNPRGEGPLGVVRVRFKIPGTTDYREHEWTLAYDGTSKAFEQAAPSLRLAGTAAAFSEWLVASPFAAEVGTGRLLGYLNGVAEAYPGDPRPKKLEAMLRQAGSLAGK
jgi:Mg-chelatase subunit ChlD